MSGSAKAASVERPILPAATFGRLKAGCRQDCMPHINSRMSVAVSVKNPTVSKLGANGSTTSRLRVPNVGLNPTTPQYDAGRRIDPCVCDPSANGTMPAATAAADPLELPPGVRFRSRGFLVGAGSKYAKAVVCVFPTN